MTARGPLVTIVIPAFNDEEWIGAALDSCLEQTLTDIEIVCVDDASTDGTCSVIERYRQRDGRIRLIRQERNRSAFQARRAGVEAATAPYILFLDADDELARGAAKIAVTKAKAESADLVGFGVEVVGPSGASGGGFQQRLQPSYRDLVGEEIHRKIFPAGKSAQGQLWRYLFASHLLRDAYAELPVDLELPRANDLPIAFLAVSGARRFVSVPDKLYRYFFRRGGSGHLIEDVARFDFYLGAVTSIESIATAVRKRARTSADPDHLLTSYESARLSVIANVLGYLLNDVETDLRAVCIGRLHERVSAEDAVMAAVSFKPGALALLAQCGTRIDLGERVVRSVLLTTKSLTTGGVSAVLLSQARYLMEAGFEVTIVARRPGSDPQLVPPGAKFVQLAEAELPAQVSQWRRICIDESIDVVIDHQVLYSRDWPAYALMARALGVPTIGWLHNFAGRPIYDLNDLLSLLTAHLPALGLLVTLSPLDVAFWKLRGISHTVYLPNPPSPMILDSVAASVSKSQHDGPLELIWWGRLEEHTKQVRQLVQVAAQLRRLEVDFRMTIIGPDWPGLSAADLRGEAEKRQLSDVVDVIGPKRGADLIEAIDRADIFVNTSIIEGYPMTLMEAQSRGLPVAMYELPWLALAEDNRGIVTAPQGDAAALARRIAEIAEHPERLAELSRAAISAARQAEAFDFGRAYQQLVTGTLPREASPEPTLADAKKLIDLMVFFAERHAGLRSKARTGSGSTSVAASPRQIESSAVRGIRPVGRWLLRRFPFLRPIARRVNRYLAHL